MVFRRTFVDDDFDLVIKWDSMLFFSRSKLLIFETFNTLLHSFWIIMTQSTIMKSKDKLGLIYYKPE